MWQTGIFAGITEFIGAVALGARVTSTIKNDIVDIDRFRGNPSILMLAMGCAELGSATWITTATRLGFPVSTTQTVVGALIGVGFATQASISWEWKDGSISQVAASWAIAPLLAACFAAVLFATLKYGVLERKNSFKNALHAIPFYLAFTAGVLALFIAIEVDAPELQDMAGVIAGSVLAVLFGVLIIAYVFFVPFFTAKLEKQDPRLRIWHIPLGQLLLKENPPLYFPGKGGEFVTNYYENAYGEVRAGKKYDEKAGVVSRNGSLEQSVCDEEKAGVEGSVPSSEEAALDAAANTVPMQEHKKKHVDHTSDSSSLSNI